ncbi:MAG: leucine--tRNA ligase, partial [Candidatus Nanoarchaeia archaeon]
MNYKEIEAKWQKKWDDEQTYKVEKNDKPKYYILEMFPYPSGSGLHMGHALNYTIGDIQARFKHLQGFNVLHPMGFDALGLPAENAAINAGTHPQEYTQKSIKHFIKQQKQLGLSYDWSRVVNTSDPSYYKWDQWIFLQLVKKGLEYQKESSVNWCPKCNTVLANEQVQNEKCWRHEDTTVEVRKLKQWFIKTTEYADELYDSIDALDWPARTKAMQKNWIGKSHGTEVYFKQGKKSWAVFTTRPDTLYGVTFVVVAAQHPELDSLVTPKQRKAVDEFLKKTHSVSEKDLGDMQKEGVFTGSYVTHPLTNEEVPVYAGNFVVADYGSGMVMAVPAHDQRDFEFAKKYDIPIKQVISGEITKTKAFTESGKLLDSKQFTNLNNNDAKEQITNFLEEQGKGKRVVNFKLRDWGVSRQRYWGTPIPIIHCKDCGAVAVAEDQLPVTLPKDVTFGKGNPLKTNKDWLNVSCPKCGKNAQRETDTMDTFVNSSWYFLRYTDPQNDKAIFDPDKANYWAPVDTYIGGAEHACMHLIYFRFYTKFLRDLGLVDFDEPAKHLFHQGMLHGEDGDKMSKSKGNVVLPETVSKNYGIDTARLFLVSLANPDKNIDWSEKGIKGSLRFIEKIDSYIATVKPGTTPAHIQSAIHRSVRDITHHIKEFKYNLAIITLRELFAKMQLSKEISKEDIETFIVLLHPFCPHFSEEWWEQQGHQKTIWNSVLWPTFDEEKIDEAQEYFATIDTKISEDINKVMEFAKIQNPQKITIIVSDPWKYSFFNELKKQLKTTRNGGELIKHFMSNESYKPYGKVITKIIPSVLKDASKMPEFNTTQKDEFDAIKNIVATLQKT